jgi:hypothetical protein
MKSFFTRSAAVAVAIAFLALGSAQAAEERSYLLATATTGGTYYPVGVAIATLTKVKLQPKHKISMSAINSAGSGENVKLLRDNEVQFAILQGLFGYYAWNGKGPIENDGPQKNLRSVTMLWQNVEHFTILAEKAKTGTIADIENLKGERMALGAKNSGTLGSNKFLLGNLGIDADTAFEMVYGGYGPSADALQNGQIAGLGIPGGAPTGAITRVMAAMGDKIKILDFTDEQLKKADGGFDLYTRYVIKAGTYPGQEKDINTIAQPNFLAVRADIDEDAVYMITKTIYENLPFLNAIHKATKVMSLEKALAGLPMPLHPGAAKYFQEVGLEIPARLMPQ